MDNTSLAHHGTKGMRWGIRRYQNKDGSLTKAGKKRYGNKDDAEETVEEKRARLLKSTDADELYKNRGILSTAEINERLNRIDTERRLGEVAAKTKKTGFDYVDKALKVGRKINEVYEFTNTPVMKALKKKLGLEEAEKRLGLDEVYKNRDKLSDKQLTEALKRANTEKAIKKILDDNADAAKAAAQKKVDEYNAQREREASSNVSSPYRVKGKNVVDSVLSTNSKTTMSEARGSETLQIGQRYIAGLLEAPKGDGD